MSEMRDLLETQILQDAKDGDTTVLAEILNSLKDKHIYGALSDVNQNKIKSYYDVHVSYDGGGYSIGVVCPYPMDEQRVINKAIEDDLFSEEGDDLLVDSVDDLTEDEYNTHF